MYNNIPRKVTFSNRYIADFADKITDILSSADIIKHFLTEKTCYTALENVLDSINILLADETSTKEIKLSCLGDAIALLYKIRSSLLIKSKDDLENSLGLERLSISFCLITRKFLKKSEDFLKAKDGNKKIFKNLFQKEINDLYLENTLFLALKYYIHGDLPRSISYFNETYERTYESTSSNTEQIALNRLMCRHHLASIFFALGDLGNAAAQLYEADKIIKSFVKTNNQTFENVPYAKTATNLADKYFETQKYVLAIKWYEAAKNYNPKSKKENTNYLDQQIKIAAEKHTTEILNKAKELSGERIKIQCADQEKQLIIQFSDDKFMPSLNQINKKIQNRLITLNRTTREITIDFISIHPQELHSILNNLDLQIKIYLDDKQHRSKMENLNISDTSEPKKTSIKEENKNPEHPEEDNINNAKKQEAASEELLASEKKEKKKKKQNTTKKPEEKKKSKAEELGFSPEYAKKTIYGISSNYIPEGIYFGFFAPPKDTALPTETLKHHENVLSKGNIVSIGTGIKFIRKGKELRFKTSISSNSPAGNIRIWSKLAAETLTSEGKKIYLHAFNEIHDHKSQKREYKK